jgi:2-methylcitrate dehydratase
MRERVPNTDDVERVVIHTSHHTHYVIGTGANDPQKMDPKATRETLDHSIMYIFAVALQDGRWHHVDSYTPKRAGRAGHGQALAQDRDPRGAGVDPALPLARPDELAFGARVEIFLKDGTTVTDELAVANAHPLGARPFGREDYIRKFRVLTDGLLSAREVNRFLEAVQDLPRLAAGELGELNVALPNGALLEGKPGIF